MNISKRISKGAAALFLGGIVIISGAAKKTEVLDKPPVEVKVYSHGKESSIKVPIYNNAKVPPFHCARYARMAAKEISGFKYPGANAWNIRYHVPQTVSLEGRNLESLMNGSIEPGTMVGFYHPRSRHRNDLDEKGKPVRYTHVGVFLGSDKSGDPMFTHQFGSKVSVVPLSYMTNDLKIQPIEAMLPFNYTNSISLRNKSSQ